MALSQPPKGIMEIATKLFNRLTEVEKIGLRMASPGRVEYLADTVYKPELGAGGIDERAAILVETQALAMLQFVAKGQDTAWTGVTWKF